MLKWWSEESGYILFFGAAGVEGAVDLELSFFGGFGGPLEAESPDGVFDFRDGVGE